MTSEKQSYTTPELKVFGTLNTVTQAGSKGADESATSTDPFKLDRQ
jgi:hypothetical protein